jgi:hypothetical protein
MAEMEKELLGIARELVAVGTYTFFTDPGHGWLEVDRSELDDLGILKKITKYSYQKGDKVYLEEDLDAGTFLEAKKRKGEKVNIREKNTNSESRIRNFGMFRASERSREAKVNFNRFTEDGVRLTVLEALQGNFKVSDTRKKANVFLKKVKTAFDVGIAELKDRSDIEATADLPAVGDVIVASTGRAGTAFMLYLDFKYVLPQDYELRNLQDDIFRSLEKGFKSVGINF